MIIDDLDAGRAGRAFGPFEADAPPVIDADAVLALPVAFERFKSVARQSAKVSKACRGFHAVEPVFSPPDEAGKFPHGFALGETFGPLVPKAPNHCEERSATPLLRKA